MKKKDHTGIRNGKMFCFHCGGEYEMNLPQPINMVVAMSKVFSKQHKGCEPTWKQPVPAPTLSMAERITFWANHGEHGTSSKCIFSRLSLDTKTFIMGSSHHPMRSSHHPIDPDDFRRCHGLLEMVPEWRLDMHLMKDVSPVWSSLVDNWDELTRLLKEQMEGKKNNMYEVMKSLGC